jgi:hypothetical protein
VRVETEAIDCSVTCGGRDDYGSTYVRDQPRSEVRSRGLPTPGATGFLRVEEILNLS